MFVDVHNSVGQMTMTKQRPGTRHTKSTPATRCRSRQTPFTSTKRRQWHDTSMAAAMEAMKKGSMSMNKTALLHGVPRSSLQDRLTGKVVHGTNPGPKPYLSASEERALADRLVEAADVGCGKTRTRVKAIVGEVAQEEAVL